MTLTWSQEVCFAGLRRHHLPLTCLTSPLCAFSLTSEMHLACAFAPILYKFPSAYSQEICKNPRKARSKGCGLHAQMHVPHTHRSGTIPPWQPSMASVGSALFRSWLTSSPQGADERIESRANGNVESHQVSGLLQSGRPSYMRKLKSLQM